MATFQECFVELWEQQNQGLRYREYSRNYLCGIYYRSHGNRVEIVWSTAMPTDPHESLARNVFQSSLEQASKQLNADGIYPFEEVEPTFGHHALKLYQEGRLLEQLGSVAILRPFVDDRKFIG